MPYQHPPDSTAHKLTYQPTCCWDVGGNHPNPTSGIFSSQHLRSSFEICASVAREVLIEMYISSLDVKSQECLNVRCTRIRTMAFLLAVSLQTCNENFSYCWIWGRIISFNYTRKQTSQINNKNCQLVIENRSKVNSNSLLTIDLGNILHREQVPLYWRQMCLFLAPFCGHLW